MDVDGHRGRDRRHERDGAQDPQPVGRAVWHALDALGDVQILTRRDDVGRPGRRDAYLVVVGHLNRVRLCGDVEDPGAAALIRDIGIAAAHVEAQRLV